MKAWKIFLGILCIIVAVFGILDAIGINFPIETYVGELSWFIVLMGTILFYFFIKSLFTLKISNTVFSASLLFMVFEKNIAFLLKLPDENIINNWYLLLLTILLCIGLGFLIPKRKKTNRNKDIYICHSLKASAVYIDCADFTYKGIENNMSSTTVHFENTENYFGGGKLNVENNMGSVKIFVPSKWCVHCDIDNNLGSVSNVSSDFCANGPVLTITGDNNMGAVVISPIE